MGKKVLVIPDTHFPWVDQEKLNLIYLIIEKEKPDVITQCGDLLDLFSHSKFARSLDIYTPNEEVKLGRAMAEKMWEKVRELAPKATLYQLHGNHDARIHKRIQEKYPEIASIIDVSYLWKFKGVNTLEDDRDYLEIDGIIYVHGWLTRLGQHMHYFNKSVVHGHTHRGGIHIERRHFFKNRYNTLFELDCGYIADDKQIPLQYGATKAVKWVHGCGLIDSLGPRFIPL